MPFVFCVWHMVSFRNVFWYSCQYFKFANKAKWFNLVMQKLSRKCKKQIERNWSKLWDAFKSNTNWEKDDGEQCYNTGSAKNNWKRDWDQLLQNNFEAKLDKLIENQEKPELPKPTYHTPNFRSIMRETLEQQEKEKIEIEKSEQNIVLFRVPESKKDSPENRQ